MHDIQKCLSNGNNNNCILVEYFLTIEKLYLFVVDRKKFEVIEISVSYDELKELIINYFEEVHEYIQLINDDGKQISNKWLKLSKYLIEPLNDWFQNIESEGKSRKVNLIYFVPHSILHYLPLHALPLELVEGEEPKVVIDNYKVAYLPSSSMLQFYDNMKDDKFKTCISFGVAIDNKEKEFLEEAEEIAKIFNGNYYEKVTKDQVAKVPLNTDILHFSCHGFFFSNNPLYSGIVMQDGILTAREILTNQKIEINEKKQKPFKINAKLVTLSACETGISESKPGDELIGLPRAFLSAGADSVAVSLWRVNSSSTKEIMIEFYSNIKSGDDKATALQKAQIKIRERWKKEHGEKYAHPYFWAPFVLVGDWR